jgi:DNA-binding response OmpR family regulator
MKTILIVDDDRDVFESMKIVLEAEGYAVHWATSGARR